MINYILLSIATLGIAYWLYRFFLKREKCLNFNRFFLLGSLILALVIPSLEVDYGIEILGNSWSNTEGVLGIETEIHPEHSIAPQTTKVEQVEEAAKPSLSISKLVFLIYSMITVLLLFRFGKNLFFLIQKIKAHPLHSRGSLKILPQKGENNLYSFFDYLFIAEEDHQNGVLKEEIYLHESAHSKQLHTLDLLFVELLICFFWFNPFIWLYKREIVLNHEFLADEAVLKTGKNKEDYFNLLIQFQKQTYSTPLSSGFGLKLTKNRITMMYKSKKSNWNYLLKGGLAVFSLVLILALSSFSPKSGGSGKTFVVLVDAGHGGEDPGGVEGKISEKNINLQLAKQLENLSETKNIKIILSRTSDEFIGLNERVRMAKQYEADMVLSFHMNQFADQNKRGFEVFYSPKNNSTKESEVFAKRIADNYLKDKISVFPSGNKSEVAIKQANFTLLREPEMPAIMIHPGFISNPEESERLTNEKWQKRFAENIYESLVEISSWSQK